MKNFGLTSITTILIILALYVDCSILDKTFSYFYWYPDTRMTFCVISMIVFFLGVIISVAMLGITNEPDRHRE